MHNESVKKSPETSKNALEEKKQNPLSRNLYRIDQHVYNKCYELRPRAIKILAVVKNVESKKYQSKFVTSQKSQAISKFSKSLRSGWLVPSKKMIKDVAKFNAKSVS